MKARERLDKIFNEVDTVILQRQNQVTGLLPASTSINEHGNYNDAWVRDNVYSILCVWTLGMAYRRQGETVRSDQLEQCTIKLMRGLLLSMMRQSDKVERFKHTQNPLDALHAKYDTSTGLPVVADHEWGHLQLDATSIYLLFVAQMTASGLRIIRTFGEVDFIQNLIYYIATAYRTPDFGIWERGNKINNGKTEINASSVGMAKAALQALDGLNLFGPGGSPRAVVHTIPDSISLARHTLAALLPRESLSKEVDSALLSVIGFPAFAVGDTNLITKTRDEVLSKLGGKYGCKRFLWDGHQTVLEESSRIYYEHSELANFEHIESEWPLFFTYLYIQAIFDGNDVTAKHYREKLEALMVEVDGFGLLPELYYLPEENVVAEKKQQGSQTRLPNENIPLVWAQSLYITGLLLDEQYVQLDDLDPLRVRNRARLYTKKNIALVVLAENDEVKNTLHEHGVISESLDDISPIKVISAEHLVETYTQIGANTSLGLTGRPRRRLQSLATSQTYDVNGVRCLCLSWLQCEKDAYLTADAELTADTVQREIAFINTHWLNDEVAVFTWMVDQRFCDTPNAETLFKVLREYQMRTRMESVGYAAANLAFQASRINHLSLPNLCITPFRSRIRKTEPPINALDEELMSAESISLLRGIDSISDDSLYHNVTLFMSEKKLQDIVGLNGNKATVRDVMEVVYFKAKMRNLWRVARYCFGALGFTHKNLADSVMVMTARHLSVVVGPDRQHGFCVDTALSEVDILNGIASVVHDPLERVLVQEMLVSIGSLIRTDPRLFVGLRSIQIRHLMTLAYKAGKKEGSEFQLDEVAALAPSRILEIIRSVFSSQRKAFTKVLKTGFGRGEGEANQMTSYSGVTDNKLLDTDWVEWRFERGLITRFEDDFLEAIWKSLAHAKTLIFADRDSLDLSLDCEFIRSSMTPGEASFAHHIDQIMHHLHPVYFKSAVVEALFAFTQYCASHPKVEFLEPIIFNEVLEKAAEDYIQKIDACAAEGVRNLDVFLECSPEVFNRHVCQVFKNLEQREGLGY